MNIVSGEQCGAAMKLVSSTARRHRQYK